MNVLPMFAVPLLAVFLPSRPSLLSLLFIKVFKALFPSFNLWKTVASSLNAHVCTIIPHEKLSDWDGNQR